MRVLATLALISALGAAPFGPGCPQGCCCAEPPRTDSADHGCCVASGGGHEAADVSAALQGHSVPADGEPCGSCTCVHGMPDSSVALPAHAPLMAFAAMYPDCGGVVAMTPPVSADAFRPLRLANIDPAIPTVVLLI